VYIERDPAKWDADADAIMSTADPAVEGQISQLRASQDAMVRSKESKKDTAAKAAE
jgi:hypothetical protein